MSARKFRIEKQSPLMRGGYPVSGESIVEVICESHKNEARDAFIRRYNNEPLPVSPPPKPVVPVIEPIFADDEPRPTFNYESATAAAAAKPKWEDIFLPSWPGLSASEALADLFTSGDIVLMTSGSVDAVEAFGKLSSLRHGGSNKICVNPIVAARCRAPKRRQNIVVVFPGPNNNLTTQMERAMYLGRLLPLELSVFIASSMSCEHWFSVGDASSKALKKFALEALRLGAAPGTFSPNYLARMPSAIDPAPGPIAAKVMLSDVGLPHTGNAHMVLFKRHFKGSKKSRAKKTFYT